MLFRSLRTEGAAFPTQQHSATCYIFGGGQEFCCSHGTHSGEDRRAGLSLITRTTLAKQHTCLQCSVAKLVVKLSQHCREFYKRPVKISAGKPSEDLPIMGREVSEVCFQSAGRLQTHLFFFIAPSVRSSLAH